MTRKVITIMLAAAMFAALTPLQAQWITVLNETFNGTWGPNADNPPAGWTINYDGTMGASDWHRLDNWSTTSSPCAYYNYNPSETGVDELISPVFDCSNAEEVYVAATHYYSHYSGAYTAQWVGSIDGGATFPYVIFDYEETTVGPRRDSLPFPEAEGEANVCIAFRGDGYTWNMNYWYMDEVMVWINEGTGIPGVFLTEDFEDASFPPMGWEFTTEEGTNQWFTNDYWDRPNYAGGSGYCADNDDDAAGAGAPLCQYNCLTTYSMDCSDAAVVTLEYTMSYNHGANAEARVEVLNSTGSWIVVNYRDDVDPTGPGKVESYNISKYAAGEEDVRIRFIYHEFSAGQNGWFEVDNVEVRECAGVDTLMYENFNSAWGPYANYPPAGWTINYTGTANASDWFNGSWGSGTSTGGGVPDLYWSPYETAVDEFISPSVNCSDYSEIWLAFEHEYNHFSSPYTNQILGSTNGGSSWPVVIWDYNESSYNRSRDSIDISSWAGGQSAVAFNWYANGNNYNLNYRAFDDVLVVAFEDCGLPPPYVYLDLDLVQIIRPREKEEGGVAFKPSIKIFNNVDSVAHATGSCKIKNLTTQNIVYEDALSNVAVDPGYNVVSGFKEFTPEANTKYEATFVIEHPDDINTTNNVNQKKFTTELGVDVTPNAVLAPAATQQGTFQPKATYKENAGAESTDAVLYCEIKDASETRVYIDSVQQTFAANQEMDVEFGTRAELAEGTYTIAFWAEDRGNNISHPPLSMTFTQGVGVEEGPSVGLTNLEVSGNTIKFSLANRTYVSIRVYDAAGKLVETLIESTREAGYYTYQLHAEDFSSGLYFVRMSTPDYTAVRKLTLLH